MRKTDSHANRRFGPEGAVALVAAGFALILTGCGFQPLYGAKSGAKQSASVTTMAAIDVAPITDRAGQVLRNGLLDRITPRAPRDNRPIAWMSLWKRRLPTWSFSATQRPP